MLIPLFQFSFSRKIISIPRWVGGFIGIYHNPFHVPLPHTNAFIGWRDISSRDGETSVRTVDDVSFHEHSGPFWDILQRSGEKFPWNYWTTGYVYNYIQQMRWVFSVSTPIIKFVITCCNDCHFRSKEFCWFIEFYFDICMPFMGV